MKARSTRASGPLQCRGGCETRGQRFPDSHGFPARCSASHPPVFMYNSVSWRMWPLLDSIHPLIPSSKSLSENPLRLFRNPPMLGTAQATEGFRISCRSSFKTRLLAREPRQASTRIRPAEGFETTCKGAEVTRGAKRRRTVASVHAVWCAIAWGVCCGPWVSRARGADEPLPSAVDATSDLLVLMHGTGRIERYDLSTGAHVGTFASGLPPANCLLIDKAGRVLVSTGNPGEAGVVLRIDPQHKRQGDEAVGAVEVLIEIPEGYGGRLHRATGMAWWENDCSWRARETARSSGTLSFGRVVGGCGDGQSRWDDADRRPRRPAVRDGLCRQGTSPGT